MTVPERLLSALFEWQRLAECEQEVPSRHTNRVWSDLGLAVGQMNAEPLESKVALARMLYPFDGPAADVRFELSSTRKTSLALLVDIMRPRSVPRIDVTGRLG